MKDLQKQFHFGVYGVIEKDNQILVVHKVRGPYQMLIDLPGGKPEHGENLAKALKREIFEETGLIVHSFSFLKETSCFIKYFNANDIHVELCHIGLIYRIDSVDLSKHNSNLSQEDINGSSWVDRNSINKSNCSPMLIEALDI
ncbi:MAG: NUDIX domain-containing protein [Simkaniaceae bacterium]|nr:NUDIX domain-containing protein [Simkaniaceae bacterium]